MTYGIVQNGILIGAQLCDRCGNMADAVWPTGRKGYMCVCDACLDRHYLLCDGCDRYFDKDKERFTETRDGDMLCEECARDAEGE